LVGAQWQLRDELTGAKALSDFRFQIADLEAEPPYNRPAIRDLQSPICDPLEFD
jgi:hypothetical protein